MNATTNPTNSAGDGPLHYFLRHVVVIYLRLAKGSDQRDIFLTGFVLSVHNCWLLMTAGHCITDIEKCRKNGYEITAARLLDGLAANARFQDQPVPFDYDSAKPMMIGRHHTADYGVLFVPDNTRAQLEVSRFVALTEKWWEPEVDRVDKFWMVGSPEVGIEQLGPDRFNVMSIAMPLVEEKERPEGFEEPELPAFYGRLLENPLPSLKGLSGAPIFAITSEGEQARYSLYAMQVSALRGGKHISGMFIRPLAKLLQEVAEGKHTPGRKAEAAGNA